MSITISPGHWSTGGANGIINEVLEARKVVNRVIEILRSNGITTNHVEDNTSKNQQQNLHYIVTQHNKTNRKLDVSVHFNAATPSTAGKGVEVLYYDRKGLASKLSKAIADVSGLRDRGAKERKELAFLNGTKQPAILIEVCFVSDSKDVEMYRKHFDSICFTIAKVLAEHVGEEIQENVDQKEETEVVQLLNETGRKEIRELLLKAGQAGIIDAKHHTKERVAKYSDVELLSYQAAVVNREFK